MERTIRRVAALMGVFFCLTLLPAVWGAETMMQDGTWLRNTSTDVVQAEIDGKGETVCLPRVEFLQPVDRNELQNALKNGIRRQAAVFHLYHDGVGRPKRVGNLLFSQDVFLKDLKMTYIGYLRSIGYKLKVSKKPAFEDRDYLRDVQSGAYLAEKTLGTGPTATPASPGATPDTSSKPTPAPPAATGFVKTSWDVMPAGVLHPSVRKMKKELDEKIREIKARPYQKEIIQVDPVRWASGRMGTLNPDGTITQATVEGQRPRMRLTPPTDPGWLTPARVRTLASQPCEFILLRDQGGRDLIRDGIYPLADVYFVDLGLTWNDWLAAEGLHPATATAEIGMATGPVVLAIKVVEGTWGALKAPVLAEIAFPTPPEGVGPRELLRVPPPEKPAKDLRSFLQRFNTAVAGQPVSVSLLYGPDGRPYLELGQKRAARILFPQTGKTLAILAKDLAKDLANSPGK